MVQQELLDGKFICENDIHIEAKELLREMKADSNMQEISDHTDVNDFRNYVQYIKERTSSAPSGRHYVPYKVMHNMNTDFLRVIHGILNLALQRSIVLARWKKQ